MGRSRLVFGRLRSASWLTGVQSMERAGRRDALSHLFPLSAQFYGEMIDTRGGMVGTWRRCAAPFRLAARSARRAPPALLRLAGLEASCPCWRRPREPGILTLPAGAWLPPPPLQSRLRTPPSHPFMSGLRVPGAPAQGSGCRVTLNSPPRGPGRQLTAHLTDLLLSLFLMLIFLPPPLSAALLPGHFQQAPCKPRVIGKGARPGEG